MNAAKDEPQEPTSSYSETSGSVTARLPDILAAHQQWVQTSGKEGKRADLAEATLGRASLRLVVLSDANLQGADLERAILANARLQGANLQGASLRSADLQLAALHRANMQGADLFEANLENANLSEATLQGANLYFANLRGSDLQRVSLQRALLKEAILQGANLSGANLSGANLQGADLRGADLRRANLREANLVEADLQGVDLQGADLQGGNLQDATLHHANVRDVDLTSTAGLVGAQLAGTFLAGTRLPTALSAFTGLTNVTVLVKQARKLLTLLVLGCAFSWLIIASATDARLLTNAPAALLPHLIVPLPSAAFFHVMPLLLLGLFIYFHLHLHRLWEELAELPAVFPDGRSLDRTAYPWLLLGLVRGHVRRLRTLRPPLSRLQSSLAIVLAWWLVPASLLLFWIRYLPCQDWVVTTWHITLLVIAIGFAMLFQSLARTMLRGRTIRRFQHGAVALLFAFACHVVFSLLSFGALTGIPPHLPLDGQTQSQTDAATTLTLRQLVPRLLGLIGASPFATLAEVDVSTKLAPLAADGGEGLHQVKGANLLGRNLRYANATEAFLAKADLRRADLSGADLRRADLRGAHFEGAELLGTNLQGADLSFATGLTREQLSRARLDATTRLPAELNVPVPASPAGR
jgi:uncharacterized protein YjbI with pentapeptide repeats